MVTVQPRPAPLVTELPGRVEASRMAQVRARVNGIVQKRLFREGSEVKAGQLLFQIDPAPYQAAVDSAKAGAGQGQANLLQAKEQATRFKPLADAKAISAQEYVNAQARAGAGRGRRGRGQRRAAHGAAEPGLCQRHRADLRAHRPRAGDRGRAGVGDRGHAAGADPADRPGVRQLHAGGGRSGAAAQAGRRVRAAAADLSAVRIVLDDGSELPQRGRLLFSDLSVDPSSAQVTLRTEVANPQAQLLPGMYVRTRLVQGQIAGAMLVPQQAVTRGPQGDSVLVVGEGGKAAPRTSRSAVPGLALGRARRPEGRRAGHRRRLPEDAPRRAGEAGAVDGAPPPARPAPAAASAPASAASR